MTTLVVYREDNLANPAKLLTHVEDIQAELARFALPFRQYSLAGIDLPKERAPSLEALRAGALDILLALQEEGGWSHAELHQLPAVSPHAVPDPGEGEPEHCHDESGARCFLRGGGVLCLRLEGVVLALGCYPGDILTIPAGVHHWFRPRAGEPALVLRLANSCSALTRRASASGIAASMELPDL